jgi:hypothetical protein
LVDPNDIDTMNSELENRLDDLFGEGGLAGVDKREKKRTEHYPLAELKNLILSIDWEITDEVLEKFIQQLKDLQLTFQHDKIVMTFLQILNSLGHYIKSHRAKAHPKTFKILNSVFVNLDKVVLSREMPESAKKKILRTEMHRYKELRNQIAESKKTAAQPRAKAKPAVTAATVFPLEKEGLVFKLDKPPPGPAIAEKKADSVLTLDESSGIPADAAIGKASLFSPEPELNMALATLTEAVEDIKRTIQIEIKALKEEIRSLREQDSA